MENKQMLPVYKEYYKCGSCDSHYHISMLDKVEILCKDCNQVSKVPKDANDKCRIARQKQG